MTHTEDIGTVWTHIAALSPSSKNINLRFFVLDMKQSRRVFSKRTGKENEIAECLVGDSTGRINLIIWNNDIDLIKPQRTYTLLNGHVNLYDECMSLGKGPWGDIKESEVPIVNVNEAIDMSRPFMGNQMKKTRPRSLTGRPLDGTAGREIQKFCGRKSF